MSEQLTPTALEQAQEDNKVQRGWTAVWEMAARYHRYQVEGLEHVLQDPNDRKASLIVGYHGRLLAVDLCILSVKLRKHLGYFPHCFLHKQLKAIPGAEEAMESIGFVTGDDGDVERAVANGEHLILPPGGAWEGMRTFKDNNKVHWPSTGYIYMALKHGLDIIPVGCAGADETYIGLLHGEKIVRRLGVSSKWAWAPWTGIGPLGLYPFSPPFPAKLYQVIGEPIPTGHVNILDREEVMALHEQVKQAVQDLLDEARVKREKRL